MTEQLAELSNEIEQARVKLMDLGMKYSLFSTEVVALSGKLDELIVRFHRLAQDSKELCKTDLLLS
ncbi:MAG: aspartyl-phosphate phosphatase Spo0E family protein [Bacillota bacterium]|jgi:hypothetical protein